MSKDLLILAAGVGRRFGGLKQLASVGPHGEAIMDYTVHDALAAGFDRVVLVIRRSIEDDIRAHVARGFGRHIEVAYVFQDDHPSLANAPPRDKPWGTGHAVLVARDSLGERFAVANADDLYGHDAWATAGRFLDRLEPSTPPTWALVGYRADATLPRIGAVSRGVVRSSQGILQSIEEIAAMLRHPKGACWHEGGRLVTISGDTPVSMNLWAFSASIHTALEARFTRFLATKPGPDDEFLLPVAIGELVDRQQANVRVLTTASRWSGMTAAGDRAEVQARIAKLVANGRYPSPLWC